MRERRPERLIEGTKKKNDTALASLFTTVERESHRNRKEAVLDSFSALCLHPIDRSLAFGCQRRPTVRGQGNPEAPTSAAEAPVPIRRIRRRRFDDDAAFVAVGNRDRRRRRGQGRPRRRAGETQVRPHAWNLRLCVKERESALENDEETLFLSLLFFRCDHERSRLQFFSFRPRPLFPSFPLLPPFFFVIKKKRKEPPSRGGGDEDRRAYSEGSPLPSFSLSFFSCREGGWWVKL